MTLAKFRLNIDRWIDIDRIQISKGFLQIAIKRNIIIGETHRKMKLTLISANVSY
jgi:hypothetical protein